MFALNLTYDVGGFSVMSGQKGCGTRHVRMWSGSLSLREDPERVGAEGIESETD